MKAAEMFEPLRALINRLSRRERLLVTAGLLAFVLFVSFLTVARTGAAIEDRRSRIEYKERGLAQVVELSAGFRETQDEHRRLESRLRGQAEVSLFSHMEEMARSQGITISNMTPRQSVTEGNIKEETVEVSLEGVTLDKVAGLVNAIQRSPNMVKVSSLRIRRRGTSDDVQASFTVSSYSLVRAG